MLSLQRPSLGPRRTPPAVSRAVSLVPVLGLLVFACAEPPSAPRGHAPTAIQPPLAQRPDSASTHAAATVSADASYWGEVAWSSGQSPQPLGSTTGRVCFLSRVSGMFGSGRYVRIYASNNSWWLAGSETGVGARARCVTTFSYTTEYAWSQGQNPTNMGSTTRRACFLTRVGGDFEGSGERVEVFASFPPYGGSWLLGGSSVHAGVHARARCILYAPWDPPQPYSYSNWRSSTLGAVILQPAWWACFLSGMSGDFEGANSYVQTYIPSGSSSWYTKAGSQVAGMTTSLRAGCTST